LINHKNELVLSGYDSFEDPEYGYRVIVKNDSYGLADAACNVILAPSVEGISLTPFGVIISNGGQQLLYKFDCRTVLSDHIYDIVSPVEGLNENDAEDRPDYSTVSVNGQVGLINNKDGSLLINPIFDDIQYLSKKVFLVKLNDKSYLIDKKGNFINNYHPKD
jgi:hypothetical protein